MQVQRHVSSFPVHSKCIGTSLPVSLLTLPVPLLFCYMVETATTCQTYKHSYAEETSCGSLKGQSAFTVSRCAASQDELQEYMTVRDICYCPVRTIWWTANLSGLTVVCVCVCV